MFAEQRTFFKHQMMMRNLKWLFGGALALLLAAGCSKFDDLEHAEFESAGAEFAIPLVKARTTLQDLLENFDDRTFITIDPDGLIRLRYSGDVTQRTSEDIIGEALDSFPPIIPLLDTLMELPFTSPRELEVDFATFKSGQLSYGLIYSGADPLEVRIDLPQVQKDGDSLSFSFPIPPGPVTILPVLVPPIDLTGWNLVPLDGSLYVRYVATNPGGERVELDSIGLFLTDLDFSYIEGFLGNHLHESDRDTIFIEFFENWIQGDVFFEDPKIIINIDNSFGLPTRSVINVFQIYTVDGSVLPIESAFIENGIDFLYPQLPNEVGQTVHMSFVFDKTNSNLQEVLGSRPVALDYDVDALTNPDTLTNIRGFLTDSSFYRIGVEVELPTFGRAAGFAAQDTFAVDFSGYEDVAEVEFKIVTDNNTPLDIGVQVFFLEPAGAVLDSLFSQEIELVEAAPVDGNGEVLEKSSKVTTVAYDSERFARVRAADRLVLRAAFSTLNDGSVPVKLLAEQDVEIRMGMRLKTQ